MAPTKTCMRWAGNPFLQDAFSCRKPLRRYYSRPIRPYSSTNQSAKPRPYIDPPKRKPLVGTKSKATPANPSSIPSNSPNANPKSGGVAAPYWRISLGVVLCGSLIYSMVPLLPPNSFRKLTYMHASSPPPYNSNPPPSQTETPS